MRLPVRANTAFATAGATSGTPTSPSPPGLPPVWISSTRIGGTSLIRVGVARDPSQAAPISGSWFGETGDYLGMSVTVTVQRH